jgi:hypothetical protein
VHLTQRTEWHFDSVPDRLAKLASCDRASQATLEAISYHMSMCSIDGSMLSLRWKPSAVPPQKGWISWPSGPWGQWVPAQPSRAGALADNKHGLAADYHNHHNLHLAVLSLRASSFTDFCSTGTSMLLCRLSSRCGPISCSLVQPESAIANSSSCCNISRTFCTPAVPPTASPYSTGLPSRTQEAPRARACSTAQHAWGHNTSGCSCKGPWQDMQCRCFAHRHCDKHTLCWQIAWAQLAVVTDMALLCMVTAALLLAHTAA